MKKKIFVIGGTGNTGSVLVDMLHSSSADFRVLCRNESKAQAFKSKNIPYHIGDIQNPEALLDVLSNSEIVYLLTSPSPDQVKLQNGLIDQAKAAGIKRIVKISAAGSMKDGPIQLGHWHALIEEHLKNSGMEYTILQPHSFFQNLFMAAPTIKNQNAIYMGVAESKLPLIDSRDVSKASFKVLTQPGHSNKTYVLTGGELISYYDICKAFSEVLGREIRYIPIDNEAYNQGMKAAGLPDWIADDLSTMAKIWSSGIGVEISQDFQKITGEKQLTIRDFVRDFATIFH